MSLVLCVGVLCCAVCVVHVCSIVSVLCDVWCAVCCVVCLAWCNVLHVFGQHTRLRNSPLPAALPVGNNWCVVQGRVEHGCCVCYVVWCRAVKERIAGRTTGSSSADMAGCLSLRTTTVTLGGWHG